MTDTEQLAHLVKRILGNKEMYGGESEEDKMSKVIDSLEVGDFDENTTNDTDSDNSESEKSEDGFSYKSNSDTSNSDSDSSNSSNPSEKALEFLNKRSSNNDSDSEFENNNSDESHSASESSSSSSSSSSSFSSISDTTTEEYKNNRMNAYGSDEDNNENEMAYPQCLRNARLSNIERKTDFIEKLKDKFPNLTYEGNKSQIMQLFRYIFREVNKEHPELQNSDDNFDEDKIFDYAEQYLKKLNDSNIDFKVIQHYDIDKKKKRNLYMKMLWKIHKINPKLSHGKKSDNKVYDTIIVRSAAIRKAKEMYKDSNLSQYDFMKKVYNLITPEFVNNVDINKEIEFYKSLDSNKSDSQQTKSKKSTSSTKKPAKKTTKTKKK